MRLRFGPFEVEVSEGVLRRGGARIELQDKAFDLLLVLLSRPRTLVTREALEAALWPGVVVTEQSLRQAVRRLRTALGDDDGQLVENVRGRGYRLHTDVRAGAAVPTWGGRFVGRSVELDALRSDVARPGVSTLLGPGGVGKSRLAAEVVRRADTPVWFCALNDTTSPDTPLPKIADAIGIQLPSDDPVGGIGRALAARGRGILVLDGVEALVETLAPAVAAWAAGAPQLTVLVSSREPLRIDGERRFVVPPLADALALLHERAALVTARPIPAELAERIVRRLDGLPLAIELAASRLAAMGPAELADRLEQRLELLTHGPRTAPPRHATLSAVFAWSWDLLDPRERAALGAAAVFRGGFGLPAAEQVLVPEGAPVDDLLLALVERSWLQVEAEDGGTVRYRMLETARAFVADRAPGELADARLRHARYHAGLGRLPRYRARPDSLEDLLAAVAIGFERRDPTILVGASAATIELWLRCGPTSAALELVERVLELVPDHPRVLERAAMVNARLGRISETVARAERAADLGRATGDIEAERDALFQLGAAFLVTGSLQRAELCYRAGLELAAHLPDRVMEVALLAGLARVAARSRRDDEAFALLRRTTDLARLTEERDAESISLFVSAEVHLACRDPRDAVAPLERALALAVTRGDLRQQAAASNDLGEVLLRVGDVDAAAEHLERAVEIARTVEDRPGTAMTRLNLGTVRFRQGRPEEGREALLAALAEARATEDTATIAKTLVHLVELCPSSWSDRELAAMLDEAEAMAGAETVRSWRATVRR